MQFECPQIELDPMQGRKGPPFKVLLPRAHAALQLISLCEACTTCQSSHNYVLQAAVSRLR